MPDKSIGKENRTQAANLKKPQENPGNLHSHPRPKTMDNDGFA